MSGRGEVYDEPGSAPLSVGVAEERLGPDSDLDAAYAGLPPFLRWVPRYPHSPLWLGALAGVAYGLAAVSLHALTAVGETEEGSAWAAVHAAYALWFAWVPIAAVLFVRGVERDVEALAPVFEGGKAATARLRRDVLRVPRRAIWFGVGVGLVFTAGMYVSMFRFAPPGGALLFLLLLREITVEVTIFGLMGWAVGAAVRLSQLSARHGRANLLDPGAFHPLTRNGTRLAGLWLTVTAIGMPLLLAPPESLGADLARVGLYMTLGQVGFALLALFLPTRGAHRVLSEAKRIELVRVRREIADARRDRADDRLPGLLAWEGRIERVSEWPVDAASLRRLGIFVLLPLGSWVGAALVERLVDAALR